MKNLAEYTITKKTTNKDLPVAKITRSKDAQEYIRKFYFDDIEVFESMFILLLDRQNKTIGYAKISQGGRAGTVCDTSIIAKYALDCFAHGVILAHNHPSGNLQPSSADLAITKKVKEGLLLFDIRLLDHLILTGESYKSLADDGYM